MSKPSLAKVKSVFKQAHAYILKHGWCQRVLQNDEGEVCLLGALTIALPRIYATPDCQLSIDLKFDSVNHFRRVNKIDYSTGLGEWNDNPSRTRRQVLAALRKAFK